MRRLWREACEAISTPLPGEGWLVLVFIILYVFATHT